MWLLLVNFLCKENWDIDAVNTLSKEGNEQIKINVFSSSVCFVPKQPPSPLGKAKNGRPQGGGSPYFRAAECSEVILSQFSLQRKLEYRYSRDVILGRQRKPPRASENTCFHLVILIISYTSVFFKYPHFI